MDDRNAPATHGDIQDLRTEMNGLRTETNEKIDMLRAEGNHNYHDLVERIDGGQTKLLGAFYGFIHPVHQRAV